MARNVQQFRIFLSSPGDVAEEREIVRAHVKNALPYGPFIRGRATFDVVSCDDPHAAPGLDARFTPQEVINKRPINRRSSREHANVSPSNGQ